MASNYPGSLDSFDTIASDKKTSDAVGGRTHRQMHNDLGDAIEAVQGELGTDPAGIYDTVATRLAAIDDRVLDATISDVDIAADADIDRSKIAGTALTAGSTGVYSVLDYGATGDGETDDTDAIQAAITAGTGAEVHFPPGRYLVEGTLTVPLFTTLTGTITEFGQGATGITELIFPSTTATAITLGTYATVEKLLIRGDNTGTAVGIAGASLTLRDVALVGFNVEVSLTGAFYATLENVDFRAYATQGLALSGCYNVNMYRPTMAGAAQDASMAINAGSVRSLNIFGGSIENYTNGIYISGGAVNLFGVYFETFIPDPDKAIVGINAEAEANVSVTMVGCLIYLNGHDKFVDMNGATNSTLIAHGNYFCAPVSSGAGQAYKIPTGSGSYTHLYGDNWAGVADTAVTYEGGALNGGAHTKAHIEMPANYTTGAWGAAGAATAFVGRDQMFAGKVGFYNATPAAKPTGVAVTAAGIHAALVTLGLIAGP